MQAIFKCQSNLICFHITSCCDFLDPRGFVLSIKNGSSSYSCLCGKSINIDSAVLLKLVPQVETGCTSTTVTQHCQNKQNGGGQANQQPADYWHVRTNIELLHCHLEVMRLGTTIVQLSVHVKVRPWSYKRVAPWSDRGQNMK